MWNNRWSFMGFIQLISIGFWVHYTAKGMWTPDHHVHMHLLNIPFQIYSLFVVVINSFYLWRLSTRCWSVVVEICVHFATWASVSVRQVWSVMVFQFIPKVVSGVGVRPVCRTFKIFYCNHVYMDLTLWTGASWCWNRFGLLVYEHTSRKIHTLSWSKWLLN